MVGSALTKRLLGQGHTVYSLSRHPVESTGNLVGIPGDILLHNLEILATPTQGFAACYHLAALMKLGKDHDGLIWQTNVEGTANVLDFCARYDIPHFYFCSTAYTQGRNTYENSKKVCELMVKESDIPHKTIFKPSIIMPELGQVSSQHFLQYVMLLIRVHRRAELIRRRIEGTLRLPVLRPVFRIRGNPGGFLNLVTVDAVADNMAAIKDDGTYWLTNPSPPTLKQVTEWVGDCIMVELDACERFNPTPLELAFEKMTDAFAPYLQGDKFHSDITASSITKEYIEESIKKLVSRE